jgi:hypothetical protein
MNEETILNIKIHITQVHGEPALEIRKLLTLCNKNLPFLTDLIRASFSEKPVMAKIKIDFSDQLKAKLKLKELGINI